MNNSIVAVIRSIAHRNPNRFGLGRAMSGKLRDLIERGVVPPLTEKKPKNPGNPPVGQ